MVKAMTSDTRMKKITRKVTLTGTKPIMFDRYAGDNDTKLQWWQKLYVTNSNVVALPTVNIISFLSAHNTNSAPKRLRDSRAFKRICNACLSFVSIEALEAPFDMIPFLRDGRPIELGEFGDDRDETSGIYLTRHVARLDKGIPNPKERPVLPLPWHLDFHLSILDNNEIKETEIFNLFQEGGVAIGLGTFRGVYGKFDVTQWK